MDVVLSTVLTAGTDPYHSTKKIGLAPGKKMTAQEAALYARPLVDSCRQWDVNCVILCDTIKPHDFATTKYVAVTVDPNGTNYERRWPAFYQYLEAHKEIERVWIVDVNDVAFVRPPFASDLWDFDLLIGQQSGGLYSDQWFTHQFDNLPAEFAEVRKLDVRPYSAGSFGGKRGPVMELLKEVLDSLAFGKNKGVCGDMAAFAQVAVKRAKEKTTKLFTINGRGVSPIFHDRTGATDFNKMFHDAEERAPGLFKEVDLLCRERYGLPGWASPFKAKWAAALMAKENLINAVEIGVYGARFLCSMGHAIKKMGRGGFALGIDPYCLERQSEGMTDERQRAYDKSIDFERIYDGALKAIREQKLERHCGIIRAAADEVCSLVGKIDILHIDGCHSVLASCRDVENWVPKVRSGGIVILDDTDWSSLQPARAMLKEMCEPPHVVEAGWESYRKL